MTKVSLRAYNLEIAGMVEKGQRLDEAVAHCRHILLTYPKHLDTYRLLGKAHLEARQHDHAVDIFRRVLVAVPDDFVAHVGMSIIADDRGKLDEAIWHMERAFEVQPSNAAIQAELQRLFGRRDGMEPPKIRLTRGALAHMYVQAELYTQAISEIRAVLANDPERMDMQVLLARAYFRNGQKTEAADVCSSLLAISPYCLDANRLMAEILPGTQATEAAQEYRRRVLELDPYAEFAKGSVFDTASVADASIALERSEFAGQSSEIAVGIAMGLPSDVRSAVPPESVPGWLSPGIATAAADKPRDGQDLDLPDFLRGSGWREVPAGAAEVIGAADQTLAPEAATESGAVPGELPEWARALVPNDDQEAAANSTGQVAAGNFWQMTEPTSPDTRAGADGDAIEDFPGWLRDLESGREPSPGTASSPLDKNSVPPIEPVAFPPAPTASVEEDDGLAWLEGLASKHGARPEELIASPEARTGNPPEWIAKSEPGKSSAPEGWNPIDMGGLNSAGTSAEGLEERSASAGGSSLDWLSGLADGDAFAEMEKPSENDQAPFPPDAAQRSRSVPVADDDLTDWLADKLSGPVAPSRAPSREPSGEYESNVELPGWLVDLDAANQPAAFQDATTTNFPEWLQLAGKPVIPPPQPRTMQPDATVLVSEAAVPAEQQALPARIRSGPQASSTDAQSLSMAKVEMARGNIAAALDIYGRLIRKGKSLSEIIRELREALNRYPLEVSIWQALGDAYMRANRLQEALDAYTKAEELLR